MISPEIYWSEERGRYGEPGWRWFLIGPGEQKREHEVLALVFSPGRRGKWFYAPCRPSWPADDHSGPFDTAEEARACYGQEIEVRIPPVDHPADPFADLPLFAAACG